MELFEVEVGNDVIIPILGSDILDSRYMSVYDCALAKATKRYFNVTNVCAGSESIQIKNKDFLIDRENFNSETFKELKESCSGSDYNKIVTNVKITCLTIYK